MFNFIRKNHVQQPSLGRAASVHRQLFSISSRQAVDRASHSKQQSPPALSPAWPDVPGGGVQSNELRAPCRRLLQALLTNSTLLVTTHPAGFALIPVLVRIAAYSHRWIRDPESWSLQQAETARGVIRSLLNHLFALWPVPEVFESAWWVKGEVRYIERDWYCHVAAGGGLRKLPACHHRSLLGHSILRCTHPPVSASGRRCVGQVEALGGSDEFLAEVLASRMVGDLSNDAIWSRLIEKMVAASEFKPSLFGIIADTFLELLAKGGFQRVELLLNPPLPELLRHCRRYWKRLLHASLNQIPEWGRKDIHCANLRSDIRSQLSARWQPLADGAPYQANHQEGGRVVEWRIVELLDQLQLTAEGQAMRHCVQSYGRACRAETCAIFSLRTDGTGWQAGDNQPPHRRGGSWRPENRSSSRKVESNLPLDGSPCCGNGRRKPV